MYALLLTAVGASAPCLPPIPANEVCITWTAPSLNTDTPPTPIVLPISYNVWQQSGSTWVLITTTKVVALQIKGLPLGAQCFRVTAFYDASRIESTPSLSACKTLRLPAPTDGSIEAPTDGSIEYPK